MWVRVPPRSIALSSVNRRAVHGLVETDKGYVATERYANDRCVQHRKVVTVGRDRHFIIEQKSFLPSGDGAGCEMSALSLIKIARKRKMEQDQNTPIHVTPDQINGAIDLMIQENPCGVCMGTLDLKVHAMLRLRDSGIRSELLTEAMEQFGKLN